MNRPLLDKLTHAVLYEGYILYPYRPSVKNQQRWTFGGLYPPERSIASDNSDACFMQAQCLVDGSSAATVEISVRFLHLINRSAAGGESGGMIHPQAWQESLEREINLDRVSLSELLAGAREHNFSFPHQRQIAPLHPDDLGSSLVVREQQSIEGRVEILARKVAEELHQLTVVVRNLTPMSADPGEGLRGSVQAEPGAPYVREDAVLRSFASTHILLGVTGGEFVSLTDPPEDFRESAASCRNIGVWPILVGTAPARDTLLASPIILPDYPEVAPESPGDLFDSAEIDEILTLRILTLTDAEKNAAAQLDPRSRALIERTESLARETLASLHGAVRPLQPLHPEEQP